MEEAMTYREYKDTLAKIGISYLGATRQSAKMRYSYNAKVATYCIYLAPYNMSGKYNNLTFNYLSRHYCKFSQIKKNEATHHE